MLTKEWIYREKNERESFPWACGHINAERYKIAKRQIEEYRHHLRAGTLLELERKFCETEIQRISAWLCIAEAHLMRVERRAKGEVMSFSIADLMFGNILRENALQEGRFGSVILRKHQDNIFLHYPEREQALCGYNHERPIHVNKSEGRAVYGGKLNDGSAIVVKHVSKSLPENSNFGVLNWTQHTRSEFATLALLKSFQHPNICTYLHCFETVGDIYAVFPARTPMTAMLHANLKLTPLKLFFSIFMQMAAAVSFLAQIGLVHRDLKVDNFVFYQPVKNEIVVELIDFGLCRALESDGHQGWLPISGRLGTLQYCAPEILITDSFDALKAEIWSLGVCFFVLLTKQLPFRSPSISDENYFHCFRYGAGSLLRNKRSQIPSSDALGLHENSLVHLVDAMLVVKPQARNMTLSEIVFLLQTWLFEDGSRQPSSS